ncbi:HIT family protein [Streptomyces chartreusis]|uniref:HIT family protein n=1 Tax=Streptomyces chartreusis TaxID=1969 RepID=UPI00123D9470|nr:HIT family protein [Streptomyces chartreusis]GGX49027.1 protein hit [Streptomyces chartreusis]
MNNALKECEFCKIAAKISTAEIIYETDSCLAFFPLNPATKGHTLVIPKQHVTDFTSADLDTFAELSSTALKVGRKLRGVYSPDGMNLITSAGRAASQSVMHLHLHLVPRWTNDKMGKIWPPKHSTDPQVLSGWAEEFRNYRKMGG